MKRKMKLYLLAIMLIYSCTLMAQNGEEKQRYIASVSLNVRSAPSAKAKIIGALSKGQEIEVYSFTNGWAKIQYKEAQAYVSAKYIEKMAIDESSETEEPEVTIIQVQDSIDDDPPTLIAPSLPRWRFKLFSSLSLGLSNFYSFNAYSHPRFGYGLELGTRIMADFMPKNAFSETSMGFMALGNSNYSFPSFMINFLPLGYSEEITGLEALKKTKWFVVGGFSFVFSGGTIAFNQDGDHYDYPSKATMNLYLKGGLETKEKWVYGIIIMHGINNVAKELPVGIKHSVLQIYGSYLIN